MAMLEPFTAFAIGKSCLNQSKSGSLSWKGSSSFERSEGEGGLNMRALRLSRTSGS